MYGLLNSPSYTAPPLKASALHPEIMITEQAVFYLLDKLKVTATGLDLIP